jgi:hypothetical protein
VKDVYILVLTFMSESILIPWAKAMKLLSDKVEALSVFMISLIEDHRHSKKLDAHPSAIGVCCGDCSLYRRFVDNYSHRS